jgi:hypothetical protein
MGLCHQCLLFGDTSAHGLSCLLPCCWVFSPLYIPDAEALSEVCLAGVFLQTLAGLLILPNTAFHTAKLANTKKSNLSLFPSVNHFQCDPQTSSKCKGLEAFFSKHRPRTRFEFYSECEGQYEGVSLWGP